MKHIHNLLIIIGNLSLVVLLIGLVALPATSVGLLNISGKSVNRGEVLSTRDIRIKIDPSEIKSGRYFYNKSTGKIEKRKFNQFQKPLIDKIKEISETSETTNPSDY